MREFRSTPGVGDTFIIKHYAIAIPEYYDFKLCIDSDFHIFCSLENKMNLINISTGHHKEELHLIHAFERAF